MSESDDDLPGVILHLRDFSQGTNRAGSFFIKASFYAETADEEVLKTVKKKLDAGLKVYTADDFKAAIAEALRKDNLALEKKVTELDRAYRALQEDARKMREALSVLDANLGFSQQ